MILLANIVWLSPAETRSTGQSRGTYIGIHYGPFLPKAPSSLQPNVYALPSEVNTTECNPPHAIL